MLNGWQSQFDGKINFLVVYIAEAHATDVWPLGNHVVLPSHTCIQDRQTGAKLLQSKGCQIPIVLDTMNNTFDDTFAVWPERFFLAKKKQIDQGFFPQNRIRI